MEPSSWPTPWRTCAESDDPARAIVGLKNHGLTIGPDLDDIFERIGQIVPTVPMAWGAERASRAGCRVSPIDSEVPAHKRHRTQVARTAYEQGIRRGARV